MTVPRAISLWGPVAACMVALFLFAGQPLPQAGPWGSDKLLHAGAYALLGLLAVRACHRGLGQLRWKPTLAALALSLAHGLAAEAYQAFVPGRNASWTDVAADGAGTVAAIVVVGILGFATRGSGPDPK